MILKLKGMSISTPILITSVHTIEKVPSCKHVCRTSKNVIHYTEQQLWGQIQTDNNSYGGKYRQTTTFKGANTDIQQHLWGQIQTDNMQKCQSLITEYLTLQQLFFVFKFLGM
jgi:hypothetical protein